MEEKYKLFEALDDVSSIFSEVNDEWTAACFEDNFSDFANFAHSIQFSVLQAFDYLQRLSELCFRLMLYAEKTNSSTEIWHEIARKNFDAKKLCIFAWYLIERGLQPDVACEDRKVGLIGSRIYISLCCLSGAQAFNIFNDYLFQRALDQLRLIRGLLSSGHLSITNNRVDIVQNTKSKNKKPFVVNNARVKQTVFEQLTLEDGTELRYMLCDVLDSLFVFLNRDLLSSAQQCLISLAVFLQQLMQLDFSEKTSLLQCKRLSDFQRLRGFSDRSFALMHRFLDNRHAASGVVYGRVVMPRLLFWTFENTVLPTNAYPPKLMTTYKEAMLNFIRLRIEKNSEEEIFTILLVLQNICFRCPDRSDYRAKVASSVIEVLAYLPPKHIRDFANFLLLIGANSKVAVRGFVIEIAVPFVKQCGHILEVSCKKENRTYDCEQMHEEDMSSGKEIPMEVDGAEEDDDCDRQKVRKKEKGKKAISNNLVKKIGLYNAILVFVIRSCNDKSPMVRTRALMQIAILLHDENIRSRLLNLSKTPMYVYCCEDEDAKKQRDDPILLRTITTRSLDARVSTRRAAIIALESLFSTLSESQQAEFLTVFQQHCRDPSLLVRKQAAESLSRLLLSFGANTNMLDKVWLTSVLPLINDREQSVVQLASKLVLETLILPAVEDTTPFVWRILEAVEQEVNHRRLLLRSLLHQAKEGGLTECAIESLLKKCDDLKNVNIVWMLLNFLSNVFKIDGSQAVRFWYTLNGSDESNVVGYVAEVIARCADRISEASRNQLIENFSTKLTEFGISEGHIAHVYYAFARLCNGIGDDSAGAKQMLEFNRNLMDKSLKILKNIIFHPISGSGEDLLTQENDKTAKLLVRIINSLGEAVQYSPILLSTNPKVFDIMQLIMASDVIQQQLTQIGTLCIAASSVRPSTAAHCYDMKGFVKQQPQQTDVQQVPDCNSYEHCVSSAGFLQTSMSSNQPNKDIDSNQKASASVNQECRTSQPTSHGLGPTFLRQHTVNMEVLTPAVRAQAVLAIGKMCLQDEKLAKKCVPVLSRQLLVNSNHLVRSNIVSVICDLCKRYTLLVDRHSAIIASCLKDPSTLVRKQTLMLLTHLIKEQFVRWAGQIMYRFVSTILDENKEVREYAEMCLIDVLLVQFPNMFVNHFLECVFYFNSVTHSLWSATTNAMEDDTERQDLKCSLSGFRLKNARMRLYRFMIKTFNDENKFMIGMRIGQEVYSAIVDGELNIYDRRVKALLEDCYEIMCCSEIKLSMALGKRSPGEADGDDDDEPPSNVQEAAKKVVTQAFRKGIIDAILPHIIQLKYYLQEKRLPELEFGIIRVLRELCKDHREQLDEFLASDKQLKAEIKFDLEKLEEKEKRMKILNNNDIMAEVPFLPNRKVSFAADRMVSSSGQNSETRKQKCKVETITHTEVQKSEQDNDGSFNCSLLFAADGMVPSPGQNSEIRKQEGNVETITHTEVQKSEQDNDGDAPIVDSIDKRDRELTEGQTKSNDDEEKNAESVQPSTSVKEYFIPTEITMKIKKRSQKIKFEQADEESELPVRAISTPEHNVGELTFGLGDDMSAIESTPTRKRSKRQLRQPCVPPIEEADNENE
ncbi:non-SMC mitotic condensation complex subunit 1 family protein [Brugia pahangi]